MANEKRLIDANALSDRVDESKHNNPHPQGMVRVNHRNEHDHFLRMIMDAPTVEAVEVVHGRWERVKFFVNATLHHCSICGHAEIRTYNYCPNCGAKMDGGNENV